MAVMIRDVTPGSLAARHGITPGTSLLQINEHEINDVLDYQFYLTEDVLHLYLRTNDGKFKKKKIRKSDEYEDLGLIFDTYLMDKQMRCANKCIFCFVDQLPDGMRQSLYFKDDDSRLSFFYGNYVTLTNMTDKDIDRIINMHISPINISVHTMNPELRVRMMKNPKSGDSLRLLYKLVEAEVPLNTQLVLCPEINDGDELRYTLEKLGNLQPSIQSIACVPLGVTKYRDGLEPLKTYTKERAAATIDIIDEYGAEFAEKYGRRLVYASDEFYILAGRELPDADYYEGYLQLDNGVGLCRSFMDDIDDVLSDPAGLESPAEPTVVSVACGTAVYRVMNECCQKIAQHFDNIAINVYPIENDFFGHTVTVSGLIVGQDLTAQLKDKNLGDALFIPPTMVRTTYPQDHSPDDLMLDDMTISMCSEQLAGIPILLSGEDGYEFIRKILEVEKWPNR